jgi:hypothetical protein
VNFARNLALFAVAFVAGYCSGLGLWLLSWLASLP